MPKTVKEAFELDKKNGNTLWAVAIAKEMRDVRVAFSILPDGQPAPVGYQKTPCHMIFDIKMEDFRRKARLVAGGHMTKAPATITYALLRKYGQSLDQNSALMPVRVPSLCALYMD